MRSLTLIWLVGALAVTATAAAADPDQLSLLATIERLKGHVIVDSNDKLINVHLNRTEAVDADFANQNPVTLRRLSISFSQLSGETVRRIAKPEALQLLDASFSQLTDADLPFLAKCGSLKRLLAEHTKLTSAGLIAVKEFPTLETLCLDGRLSDEALSHFVNLAQPAHLKLMSKDCTGKFLDLPGARERLKWLDVDLPNLGNPAVAQLRDASRLRALYLTNTLVSDAGLEKLQHLPLLGTLQLRDNRIAGSSVANFSSLRHLTWTDKHLKADQLAGLSTLKSLQELNINAERCGNEVVKQISGIHSLRKLSLGYGQLDSKGGDYLVKLTGLKELELTSQLVSRELMRDIAKLDSLDSLTLHRCELEPGGLPELLDCPSLSTLEVYDSVLTERDVNVLLALPLRSLTVMGTKLPPDCVDKLRAHYGEHLKAGN